MTAHDIDEEGITPRRPDGGGVADCPENQPDEPEPQAEPEGSRQRAVQDCDGARRATEQNGFGQGAVDRNGEAGHVIHQTSAPPPNEKKDKKKLDAAKAIDRPKTI